MTYSGNPLQLTCIKGHLPIVQHLIEKGADMKIKKLFVVLIQVVKLISSKIFQHLLDEIYVHILAER